MDRMERTEGADMGAGIRAAKTSAIAAATLALALLAAGCAPQPEEPEEQPTTAKQPTSTPSPSEEPRYGPVAEPQVMASGLAAPWSIAFLGDTPLISERDSGRILALDETGAASEVAVVAEADGTGEGGLLGIAVHDDHLYAYLTAGAENRVVRAPISGSEAAPVLGAFETLLGRIPAGTYHNGGRIAFGPDGMLYATAGDASNTSNAQDLGSLAGKILRMTPEGAVPQDNPFPGSYVYSYGHRNPQGIAWAEDGTMYASEFGQDTWDELNVIRPGGDYGWPVVEGIAGDPRYIDPVQQWRPADASPSGIAILGDSIYIANLRGERLRQVPLASPADSVERYVGEYGRIRALAVTPGGGLWMLTNNTDGVGTPGPDDDRVVSIPLQ